HGTDGRMRHAIRHIEEHSSILRELLGRQPHFERKNALRLEVQLAAVKPDEALDEQAGTSEEDQRKRDLRDDQRAAQALPAPMRAGAADRLVERARQLQPEY